LGAEQCNPEPDQNPNQPWNIWGQPRDRQKVTNQENNQCHTDEFRRKQRNRRPDGRWLNDGIQHRRPGDDGTPDYAGGEHAEYRPEQLRCDVRDYSNRGKHAEAPHRKRYGGIHVSAADFARPANDQPGKQHRDQRTNQK
jgi:hypothetical protein